MKNFGGALQIIFITLKLMGYIDWSWFLVLLPIQLAVAIVITHFLLLAFSKEYQTNHLIDIIRKK